MDLALAEEIVSTVASEQCQNALEQILEAYRRYFDIVRNHTLLGTTLPAMAKYYSRGERYVLTKRAKLWAMECYEYALFFTPAQLGSDGLRQITNYLEACEEHLVNPHSEHMYTYITGIILTDSLPEGISSLVSKYKWRRSYRLSFRGWCHIRLAVLDVSTGTVATNWDGKELRKTLRAALGNG